MPINTRELINAAEVVAQHENMRVNLVSSAKGACLTGATTFMGGLLGGPVGLAIGAMFGGISSMLYTRGQFKSVVSIIEEDLKMEDKEKLAQCLQLAVKDIDITDAIAITSLILSDRALFEAVKMALVQFITNDLQLKLES